ncbi:MAG: hypothetical protein PWP23_980 [Candidatus Sumerlaeota bacterium]|nr:hypothetical protein [Candidatus Sumerlaeota bacterium]
MAGVTRYVCLFSGNYIRSGHPFGAREHATGESPLSRECPCPPKTVLFQAGRYAGIGHKMRQTGGTGKRISEIVRRQDFVVDRRGRTPHLALPFVGVWRSWLARALREREGAGSSPATPTIQKPGHEKPVPPCSRGFLLDLTQSTRTIAFPPEVRYPSG